jgi:hypothetical protein
MVRTKHGRARQQLAVDAYCSVSVVESSRRCGIAAWLASEVSTHAVSGTVPLRPVTISSPSPRALRARLPGRPVSGLGWDAVGSSAVSAPGQEQQFVAVSAVFPKCGRLVEARLVQVRQE